MTRPAKRLPDDEPFFLDPKVDQVFAAHLAYHRHDVNSAAWKRAKAQRDRLIAELNVKQRHFARVLACTLELDIGAQVKRRLSRAA
jgi:uncharacterized C2H2 Zn-finger protein